MDELAAGAVDRIRVVLERAAEVAIAAGRAEVSAVRAADLYNGAAYDCPVVLLTPHAHDAARVAVEVQGDRLWWLCVADGPGTEIYDGIEKLHGDRYTLLERLVTAAVAGRYRHGPYGQEVRWLFRSPRVAMGWYETFDTERGPFTSRHFGREGAPRSDRLFAPYV